ncbi:hypothetical protein CEXT_701641 [Caerostris extrusa]|uniref:Uncharacterized protein n=1 Tax=Caerostris extrusa TaxID=172846 RepID=A0AAV4WZA0_CAEEX|nr:hypothetical protein CEXT_701641 [Caerostris extrusa]
MLSSLPVCIFRVPDKEAVFQKRFDYGLLKKEIAASLVRSILFLHTAVIIISLRDRIPFQSENRFPPLFVSSEDHGGQLFGIKTDGIRMRKHESEHLVEGNVGSIRFVFLRKNPHAFCFASK